MPHPNEMVHWDEIACRRGCDDHPTRTVDIRLGGPTKYHDLTPIPNRFAMSFPITVWDTGRTPVDGGPYCPARDAVSETIISHGVWEPQETTVLMLALEAVQQRHFVEFVDVGCQIGWFSKIAEMMGVVAHGYEADPAVAAVAEVNDVQVRVRRIEPDMPRFTVGFDPPRRVVKIDIEGAEKDAIAWLGAALDEEVVPFILMEVSPVFNDSYPELVTSLMDRGFHAYTLPPKRNPPVRIDQLTDLLPYRLVGDFGEVWDEVASWDQRDLVFALGGVESWT